MSQRPGHFGFACRQRESLAKLRDSVRISPQLLVGPPEVQVGLRKVLIQLETLPQFTNGQVVLTRVIETPSHQRAEEEGEWLQIQRLLVLCDGVVHPTHRFKARGIPHVGHSIVWVVIDRQLVLSLCTWPIPVVELLDCAQRRVRFSQRVVDP